MIKNTINVTVYGIFFADRNFSKIWNTRKKIKSTDFDINLTKIGSLLVFILG